MVRVLSQKRGWSAVGLHRIRLPWVAVIWLLLIAASWALLALPFVFWGWRGFWAYAVALLGLCPFLVWRLSRKTVPPSSKA